MQYKITKISVSRSDKAGQPYINTYTKKEQARVAMQTLEMPGIWLTAFVELGDPMEQWKEGQTVEIEVAQKGNFWNFKVVKPNAPAAVPGQGKAMELLFEKLNAMNSVILDIEKSLLVAIGKLDNLTRPDEDEIAIKNPPVETEEIPF